MNARSNFCINYPQFGHAPSTNPSNHVLDLKGLKNIRLNWCKIISLPTDTRGDHCGTVAKVCATNRKVVGSIPAGVLEFFIDIKSFRSRYGPGVDSASNRNEYQEYFLGVKAAGA